MHHASLFDPAGNSPHTFPFQSDGFECDALARASGRCRQLVSSCVVYVGQYFQVTRRPAELFPGAASASACLVHIIVYYITGHWG